MRAIVFFSLAVLALVGLATIAASFVPYSTLLAKAQAMSAHGAVPFFSDSFYHSVQLRLRFIGLGNVLLALASFLFRNRLLAIAHRISSDLRAFAIDLTTTTRFLSPSESLCLSGLTLFAALLRFPFLFQPMRGDETYTFLTYASHPFYVGLSFYNDTNNHLFHTLLMRLCYLLLGNHPWALRLPVFVAGVLLVPATYFAGRSLYGTATALGIETAYGRETGLLAAALVAASSPLIEYSANARGYSLFCLEFMLLIPIAAYAFRKDNFFAWTLVAGLAALGFYTMPIMLYPFGGVVLWLLLLIFFRDADSPLPPVHALRRLATVVAFGALATLELYSPVLAVSGPQALLGKKLAQPRPFLTFLHDVPFPLASTWRQWNRDLPLAIVFVLAAGFFLALLFHRRLGRQRVPIALAMLLWIVPLVLAQRIVPFDRVWLFALPLYLIVASAGCCLAILSAFPRAHARHAVLLLSIVASLLLGLIVQRRGSVYLANEGRGIEQVALYLKQTLKPGDSVVAVVPSDTLLLYYLQKYKIPSSYLNAPSHGRVLVLVNEHEGDTVAKVLDGAHLSSLASEPSTLAAHYDSASIYEISGPAASGTAEGAALVTHHQPAAEN